jgi:DNA adenine methylase
MTQELDRFINPRDFVSHEPIVQYAGGKSRVSGFLVSRFPSHTLYVDLFCGGLSVTLAKPRSTSSAEWINDKYDAVANFFIVLRDAPDEFVKYFRDGFVINSEAMYRLWTERLKMPVPIPSVECAVMFWMTQVQTYSGMNAAVKPSYRYKFDARLSLTHYLDLPLARIQEVHDRLRGVQVFSRDFREIIQLISRLEDKVFVFEDPPYWGVGGGDDYLERFAWDDHRDLAELNLGGSHLWMLTINNHPDIVGLYEGKEGVFIREFKIRYTEERNISRTRSC